VDRRFGIGLLCCAFVAFFVLGRMSVLQGRFHAIGARWLGRASLSLASLHTDSYMYLLYERH
jgi:hypothetical protein